MGVRISPPVHKEVKMSKIRTYFEETASELFTKVSWPTWAELQSSAIVVMIASLIIALIVYLMDSAFSNLLKLLYSMF
jgi:preprotein translocase subunit SecE